VSSFRGWKVKCGTAGPHPGEAATHRAPCDASPSASLAEISTATIGDRPRRIYNPVQRDAATFLETSEESGGARTLAELEVAPGGKVTPHYHLTYSERFKVLEGRLTVEIGGVRHELGPGDEAVAAPRSLHAWSNPGAERCVAQIELRPGSPGFENSLRVVYALAGDGRVLRTACPATRSTRLWRLRWGMCACPARTRRSKRSWGCWSASPAGAASTASSSAATSKPARPLVRLRALDARQ
jgi:mannose-6-phosphate isomerase-like protein (cupin superfamily)